jgi:hydroxymethylpyrimidine pyrophosphatase-like HAD family hydrolase
MRSVKVSVKMLNHKKVSTLSRWSALASDADGTLMRGDKLAPATAEALQRLRDAKFRLILATGETRAEAERFADLHMFDCVVAENGGLLFWPGKRRDRALGPPPPIGLVDILKKRGAQPLHVGKVVIATVEPHDAALHEAIAQLRLNYRVHRNRNEVMALPTGIDKGTGLKAAAKELGIPIQEIVGVGDAENDGPMLKMCGLGVAVANAVASLKLDAALITKSPRGQGVVELVNALLRPRD